MCGSTTCSANPAATAASNALPPRSSTAIPAAEASQWVEATMPKVPESSGRVVKCHPPETLASARRMTLIDGKAIAQLVRAEVRDEVAAWVAQGHQPPGLATVLVGDDAASAIYVGGKQKASAEVGIRPFDLRLAAGRVPRGGPRAPRTSSTPNPAVNGILLQLPTPPQVDGPR